MAPILHNPQPLPHVVQLHGLWYDKRGLGCESCQGDIAVHNCIHCLPCVQVTSGWLVGLSLQKGGWSCSIKGSGVKVWQLLSSSLSLRLAGVSDWPLSGDGG